MLELCLCISRNKLRKSESNRTTKRGFPQGIYVRSIEIDRVNKDVLYGAICRSRVIKNEAEIEIMKIAAKASSEGHIEMMRKCKVGLHEGQLMRYYRDYGLFAYNSSIKPYQDIIASGPNATILHYTQNDRQIQPKELILCDCAYRIGNYCADITTTFPSDGQFTQKQKYFLE